MKEVTWETHTQMETQERNTLNHLAGCVNGDLINDRKIAFITRRTASLRSSRLIEVASRFKQHYWVAVGE